MSDINTVRSFNWLGKISSYCAMVFKLITFPTADETSVPHVWFGCPLQIKCLMCKITLVHMSSVCGEEMNKRSCRLCLLFSYVQSWTQVLGIFILWNTFCISTTRSVLKIQQLHQHTDNIVSYDFNKNWNYLLPFGAHQ